MIYARFLSLPTVVSMSPLFTIFQGRFAFFVLVTISFALLPGSESRGDSWNQWRGPQRDGRSTIQWPSKLDGKLELVWEKVHQPSYSGPVVQDGLVFTTETVERKRERVTAYQLASGEKAWDVEWEGAMSVPFFAAANGAWIRSTPVVVPGHLIVLGMRDVLVSLDPQTGNENWRVDFPGKLETPLQSFGAVCSPLVHNDAVYVQAGGGLTKLALETGEVVWRSLRDGGDMMTGGAFSSPVIATLCGEKQLVVQTRQELCGVDLETGDVYWKEPIQAFRGMNILTPLVSGDTVFTAAHSGISQLFDITQTDEGWSVKERWNQNRQAYMSSPVTIDGVIYLHQKNERFAAFNSSDGELLWSSKPVGKYCSMLHNGDSILSLSEDGTLRLIQPSREDFTVLGTADVAENSWAHLAVDGDLIIIRDLNSLRVFRWVP